MQPPGYHTAFPGHNSVVELRPVRREIDFEEVRRANGGEDGPVGNIMAYLRKPLPADIYPFGLGAAFDRRILAVAVVVQDIDGEISEFRVPVLSVGELLEWLDLCEESRAINPARWGKRFEVVEPVA